MVDFAANIPPLELQPENLVLAHNFLEMVDMDNQDNNYNLLEQKWHNRHQFTLAVRIRDLLVQAYIASINYRDLVYEDVLLVMLKQLVQQTKPTELLLSFDGVPPLAAFPSLRRDYHVQVVSSPIDMVDIPGSVNIENLQKLILDMFKRSVDLPVRLRQIWVLPWKNGGDALYKIRKFLRAKKQQEQHVLLYGQTNAHVLTAMGLYRSNIFTSLIYIPQKQAILYLDVEQVQNNVKYLQRLVIYDMTVLPMPDGACNMNDDNKIDIEKRDVDDHVAINKILKRQRNNQDSFQNYSYRYLLSRWRANEGFRLANNDKSMPDSWTKHHQVYDKVYMMQKSYYSEEKTVNNLVYQLIDPPSSLSRNIPTIVLQDLQTVIPPIFLYLMLPNHKNHDRIAYPSRIAYLGKENKIADNQPEGAVAIVRFDMFPTTEEGIQKAQVFATGVMDVPTQYEDVTQIMYQRLLDNVQGGVGQGKQTKRDTTWSGLNLQSTAATLTSLPLDDA